MKWLLTHDGNKVKNLIEISDTDKIYSNRTSFIKNTQEECFTEIDNNNLNFIFNSGNTKEIIFNNGNRTVRDKNTNND
jgi:hypothetical protein